MSLIITTWDQFMEVVIEKRYLSGGCYDAFVLVLTGGCYDALVLVLTGGCYDNLGYFSCVYFNYSPFHCSVILI